LIVDTRNTIRGVHAHVFKLGAPSPAPAAPLHPAAAENAA
jgi:hypothetical protein